jgi:5-methyltetrahydrofolate--homocysteine methyltransferase
LKSTLIMKENLEVMNERNINVPVVLGGAALTRRYVEDDLKSLYKGNLFYARDAFAGLHTMDKLMSGNGESGHAASAAAAAAAQANESEPGVAATGSTSLDEDLIGEDAKLGIRKQARPRGAAKVSGDTTHTNRSDVSTNEPVPRPPFWGTRVVHDIPLEDVFGFVNETALFKGQWQFKQGRKSGEEYQAFVAEHVRPVYEELKQRSDREGLLIPRVVYGYFRCQSSGNDLIIYDDKGRHELTRFTFPRQPAGKRLCLADYFASVESGHMDAVAFDLVTMGRRASEYSQQLFKSDNYSDYLYFHGLSVESAEALAELWHKKIRQEFGIAGSDAKNLNELFRQGYQGSRFSFGYPACPNLEDQVKLFELLDPARIDVELTEEFQLDPEQSTSAIIIHHPEARYFSID